MKKRIFAVPIIATIAVVSTLIVASQNNFKKYVPVSSTENEYTMTLSNSLSVDGSGNATVKTTSGYNIALKTSNYSTSIGLGSLASDGYIANTTKIRGIKNISVSLASGDISLYYGWKQYDNSDIDYLSSSSLDVSGASSRSVNLSSVKPSFFKLVANAASVINSVTITYSCASLDTVSSFRLSMPAPTVNASEDIALGNNLWINTNVEDKNTWTSYLMVKDGDTYYYDFEDVTVLASGYEFSLFLSTETSSLTEWAYPSSSNSVAFGVGEGQSEWNIDTVYDFDDQPSLISESYSLTLTINLTAIPPESFGNIQLVYNYTNSTSAYTWNNQISDSRSTSYNYVMENLDTSKNLYFKLYIWDNDLKNCYIGGSEGANFVLTPTGSDEESATITFTYPTSGGNTEGDCEITSNVPSTSMSFANQNTTVYGTPITITPTFDHDSETFTASYSGTNIRIDNNTTIVGLKAGTTTKVTLTSKRGLTCQFNVTVASSTYTATSARDNMYPQGSATKASVNEGWFTTTNVEEISNMSSDFMNGIDVSSAKALYDNGTKFYNTSGVEQSLFYILKENGVNWIRLKLWVDPYTSKGTSYGGGVGDLTNTLWMAYEAKAAGMNLLLDFHYSDYWTHPGQQIVPKAWSGASSVNQLAGYIKDYTTETLNTFKSNGCLPDMVQVGNEISSGTFLQSPGSDSENLNADYTPSYRSNNAKDLKTDFAYAATAGSSNMNTYLSKAIEGVKAVDEDIKTIVHWAKGSQISASIINNFFNGITANYDYAGISFYPYYCFDSISDARTILKGLSISKPWLIVETSYPYSGSSYVYENAEDVTSFSITNWSTGLTNITSSYAFTASGQANLIHDLTKETVDAGGLGIFYWEGAWVPNKYVGWAASGSLNSWGNQGFFSLDGKAIANIDIFAQMSKYI